MCLCVCLSMYKCIYVCICAVFAHKCVCLLMCLYVHMCMYICLCVSVYVYVYMHIYTCVYMCVYIYICAVCLYLVMGSECYVGRHQWLTQWSHHTTLQLNAVKGPDLSVPCRAWCPPNTNRYSWRERPLFADQEVSFLQTPKILCLYQESIQIIVGFPPLSDL